MIDSHNRSFAAAAAAVGTGVVTAAAVAGRFDGRREVDYLGWPSWD